MNLWNNGSIVRNGHVNHETLSEIRRMLTTCQGSRFYGFYITDSQDGTEIELSEIFGDISDTLNTAAHMLQKEGAAITFGRVLVTGDDEGMYEFDPEDQVFVWRDMEETALITTSDDLLIREVRHRADDRDPFIWHQEIWTTDDIIGLLPEGVDASAGNIHKAVEAARCFFDSKEEKDQRKAILADIISRINYEKEET